MSSKKAVIIGAGIAGIATAVRLAVKGYTVEVFEANATPGGKLAEVKKDNFRFDAGPSLLTMPQYIDELFALAGKEAPQYFQYQKLDIICKYFYEDGTRLTAYAAEDKFAAEIVNHIGEPVASVKKQTANSARLYELTNPVFLQRAFNGFRALFTKAGFKALLNLKKLDTGRTMHQANQRFFRDARLVQFYDRYATYNGSNPYAAPATLNVIPHLEQYYGAYFPQGGMYAIVTSLVNLAVMLGVKFHYNCAVDEIVLNGKSATGIKIKDEVINADLIVSNMDIWFTYHKLLKNHPKLHPQKVLQQERSSSALVFYWGINKKFIKLDLHNIFFSADYEAEFDHIWKEKNIYHDPTVYLNITSKLNAKDAPPGCENWFVMINVPANTGQDWDTMIAEARKHILTKISGLLNENIGKLIISETILDPRDIEHKTSSYQGSIYGTSSNSKYAAFMRHANLSAKIKNLYFCGGSVHPGGGIPLCLLSAKIVSGSV
ncbi:1-hydroxycarotenoid 3,4-desaturase CrtD [Mucilaginibacter sp. UR6-11]|uniref:1-hydroxycarotenoid 3,4-desaturase CrtD n=1 Tax=Mucilaginibacter sp. UR6-11 TaxID=1435644 RepID=UPI001E53064E|nr:1-hydroxycarotenoid 3,4-desaturase CrtD [Mucilaginibacter sp. UR6-11]MCC8427275.1 phytoene desaturase [Mucilaginibacter sp. UR6-11]